MTKVIFFFAILFSMGANAQKELEISLEGYINNFTSKQKIFGASMYMFQNGRMVSKSLSDNKGVYFISGSIKTNIPFEVMVSKPGYISKKVLLDFNELKVKNPNGILQAMEELVIELFEIREGADLDFVKNTYAEKFTWDPSRNIAVPEEKYKKDIEDEVLKKYAEANQGSKAESFKKKLSGALKNTDYSLAIVFIDSALVYEPNNAVLQSKKEELALLLVKIKKDKEDREQFEVFKRKGDEAFALSDLDEAEANYNSALAIIDDGQVKYRLGKIDESRNRDQKQSIDNIKLISLRSAVDSLRSLNLYEDCVTKLKAIQVLDPGQRIKIQTEIKAIKKEAQNHRFSSSIEKYIARAQNQNSTDSLDAGLSSYRKAEMLIQKLSDQPLINTYSGQVENGIAQISSKKFSEQEAFRKQMEKAYSNVFKGREFYDLANRILDSQPMKTRSKDPKVIALKKQIKSLEEMYNLKEQAFAKLDSKKSEALVDLKSAFKIANANYRIIPAEDLSQMKDSLTSWSGGSDFITSANTPTTRSSNSGVVVQSPGQLHSGSEFEAFNDLAVTIKQKKSDPLKDLQDVRNEIEFEKFFAQTTDGVRNEASANEMKTYLNVIELNQKEVNNQNIILQKDFDDARQRLDAQIKLKEENAVEQQQLSALQIEEWNTEKDYMLEMALLSANQRNESFTSRQNLLENERVLIERQNHIDNDERLEGSRVQMQRLGFEQQRKDSLAKVAGEERIKAIESLKSSTPDYATQANFLKDENGILFPSNKMTQRVFKRSNSQGDVTSVTIQRVVVDVNGYGVVYEQTTNESGRPFYTRNNAAVTEDIWFNGSTGIDVIED